MKQNSHSGPHPQGTFFVCGPARNQILEMNAFQPDSMTFERKDSLVQHLIAESVEKFAFKAEKKEHPEEKELDKFMYVFYGGNFVDHLKRKSWPLS